MSFPICGPGTPRSAVQVDSTLDEIALLASAYNGAAVLTDEYGAQPIRQGLAARGLNVSEKPWTNETKVDAVAAVRRCLYSGRLEIPPHRELVSELVTLEQRPTPSGRPRIAARGSGRDDYATALLALVNELEAPDRARHSRGLAEAVPRVGDRGGAGRRNLPGTAVRRWFGTRSTLRLAVLWSMGTEANISPVSWSRHDR